MPSAQPETSDGLLRDATGAQKLIGWVTDLSQPDGRARLYLDIGPQHTNRHGVLHGGIIAMLLDSCCGYTGASHLDRKAMPEMLSVSFTTNFVAPASEGRVTATGHVTGGRRTLFISAELRDSADRLIATSTGVYKPVRKD